MSEIGIGLVYNGAQIGTANVFCPLPLETVEVVKENLPMGGVRNHSNTKSSYRVHIPINGVITVQISKANARFCDWAVRSKMFDYLNPDASEIVEKMIDAADRKANDKILAEEASAKKASKRTGSVEDGPSGSPSGKGDGMRQE